MLENHGAVLILPILEGRCALADTEIEVSVGLETNIRLCLLEYLGIGWSQKKQRDNQKSLYRGSDNHTSVIKGKEYIIMEKYSYMYPTLDKPLGRVVQKVLNWRIQPVIPSC